MISEESFRLFSYVIRAGYWTKILPFTWDPVSYKVKAVSHLNRWRLIALASLVVQWTTFLSVLAGVLETGAKLDDWIFASTNLLANAFSNVIQLYNFLFPVEFATLLSAIHLFARKLALYHKLDMRKKDGMERLIKPFLVPLIVLPVLTAIGSSIMVQQGHRLYKYFRTEYLGVNILVGVVWGYVTVLPFFTGVFFVVLAVNYCHSMENFLTKIRFDPEKSELEQRRDHLLFRAHQLLHVHAMEFTSTLIALILGMSCLIQIACICTMINVIGQVPVAIAGLLIVAPVVVIGATMACLHFAMLYTKASRVFPVSFREWSKNISPAATASSDSAPEPPQQLQPQLQHYQSQRRIFRTYHPFHFKIGRFMDITERTFVVATSDIVFQGVWSILLL